MLELPHLPTPHRLPSDSPVRVHRPLLQHGVGQGVPRRHAGLPVLLQRMTLVGVATLRNEDRVVVPGEISHAASMSMSTLGST